MANEAIGGASRRRLSGLQTPPTNPLPRSTTEQTEVWAMGPIPPPITGKTLLTKTVLDQLDRTGPLKIYNWSHGRYVFGAQSHAIRLFRTLRCIATLIAHGRANGNRLYLVANSRSGLLLTMVLVGVARWLGHRVCLHHHAYGYIDQPNRWMSWIDRRMDASCIHVVHCQQMIDDFRARYPTSCQFETIFPSVVSLAIQHPRLQMNCPFTLGMLSNLSIPKGTGLAIEAFRALHEHGRDTQLVLAGPLISQPAKALVDDALKTFPDRVRHLGPVYDASKVEFFRNIDALLFPTQYREESWGIVLNEALAAGVPVITFDRGCTRTVVGDRAGLVIPRDADFVARAAAQVEHWMDHPDDYRQASQAAVDQAEYLHRVGQSQLVHFAERMFAPLEAS